MTLSHLGQSGFKLELGGDVVFVDPYLSDSVEHAEGPSMRRLRPPPLRAAQVLRADTLLISHAHLDHCDPDTLLPIAANCPRCRFVGPSEVVDALVSLLGISPERVVTASESGIELPCGAMIHPVPAAHRTLEVDSLGRPRCLGFVIEYAGRRIYHSGDGSVHPSVTAAVRRLGCIDTALLPVNECNYYRDRRGIVGNMSIREAFGYAEEIGASRVVPMHYDMFAPNCAYEEEILAVYRCQKPRFHLELPRSEMSLWYQ